MENIYEILNAISEMPQLVAELKQLVKTSKVEHGRSDRDEYLTIRECADFLKLSIPTIYAHCQRSSIPYMKRGKRLFFSKSLLKSWIESGRKGWEKSEQPDPTEFLKKRNPAK